MPEDAKGHSDRENEQEYDDSDFDAQEYSAHGYVLLVNGGPSEVREHHSAPLPSVLQGAQGSISLLG